MTPSGPRLTGWMCSPFVHPLLFAAHPVLFAYAHDRATMLPRDLVRPLTLNVSVAAAIVLLFSLVRVKRFAAATISLSVVLILFFAYGHLRDALAQIVRVPFTICWLLLLVIALAGGLRLQRGLGALTFTLNAAGTVLVVMPLVSLVASHVETGRAVAAFVRTDLDHGRDDWAARAASTSRLPDIYYIILDGYGRQDILREIYHEDVSWFVEALTAKGFYVVPQARSNYGQTLLSLASSLNMAYLDGIGEQLGRQSNNRAPLAELMIDSQVGRLLRSMGYSLYMLDDRTRFIPGIRATHIAPAGLSPLERSLFSGSPLSALRRVSRAVGERVHSSTMTGFAEQLDKINWSTARFTLDHIERVPRSRGPVFVCAHVLCPHPPFLLDRDGRLRPSAGSQHLVRTDMTQAEFEQSLQDYANQVVWVSKRMDAIAGDILHAPNAAPIIVIQGDHGPTCDWSDPPAEDMRERMSILNAIHLPGNANASLYPDITPVNTFRVVFNTCFGAKYDLLPDSSYFSASHPYDFIPYDPNHVAP